jgi:hypothetical protein
MATEEKIIFSIQIDQSDSVSKIANLTKEIDALKMANKQLAAQEGDNSKAIAENNLLIKQATDERGRQSRAVLASMEAFGKEAKSIDDARSAVKQLTIERNKLDISTDAGKAKQKQLNASIDEHNKFIKENVDQYQQQKINIGNYASALGGSNTVLGQTIARFQSMKDALALGKKGLEGMEIQQASFNTVLKANIIGIIIVALTALYTLFTKFEPVVEMVEAAMSGLNAAIKVVSNRLIDFGQNVIGVVIGYFNGLINVAKALFTIFSGDFKAGFDSLKGSFDEFGNAIVKTGESFNGMGAEMSAAAQEAYNLERALQDLDDRMRAQIVTNAQTEAQVSKLLLQAKNRSLSEKERLALLDQAGKLEKENFERNKKIAQDEYDIMLAKLANGSKLSKAEIEELNTNTKRRDELDKRRGTLTDKELIDLANKKAETIKLESETANVLEKIQNRRDALLDAGIAKREQDAAAEEAFLQKQIAADEKLQAEEEKSLDILLKKREDAFKKENDILKNAQTNAERIRTENLANGLITQKQFDDQQLLAKQKNQEAQIILDQKYYKNTSEQELALAQTKLAINQKSTADKQRFAQADIQSSIAVAQAAQGVISQLASAAEQGSDLQKALALTNVAINLGTAIGNLTATTSAPSPDNLATGGIAGFVKYAAGIAQIIGAITSARNIIGGAAAGGGDFMTSGPTMLLVGDNPGGRERVTVEPISGRGKTTINPNSGLIAMAGGGTLTTTGYGGYSQRNGSGGGFIDYDMLAKSFSKLPSPTLRITELNKVQNDRANVLVKSSL